jgi:CheY-like chemotaxis protein
MLPLWAGLVEAFFCHKSFANQKLEGSRAEMKSERERDIRSVAHEQRMSTRVLLKDAETETVMLKRRKVVAVVDDDPSMLKAAEILLDAHGFATKTFVSAEEFLDRGAATQVDCLLLDIHLGGMSGIELRRQLKASGSTLPIIFISALDDAAIPEKVLKASGVTCLRKPFPAHQLIEAIAKAVA